LGRGHTSPVGLIVQRGVGWRSAGRQGALECGAEEEGRRVCVPLKLNFLETNVYTITLD